MCIQPALDLIHIRLLDYYYRLLWSHQFFRVTPVYSSKAPKEFNDTVLLSNLTFYMHFWKVFGFQLVVSLFIVVTLSFHIVVTRIKPSLSKSLNQDCSVCIL